MAGKYKGTYPRIILQFIRQGDAFDFELVTYWQYSTFIRNYEIRVELFKPSVKQIEHIHGHGSYIVIDKFSNLKHKSKVI